MKFGARIIAARWHAGIPSVELESWSIQFRGVTGPQVPDDAGS
jgi:hypothetical protein